MYKVGSIGARIFIGFVMHWPICFIGRYIYGLVQGM